MKTFNNFTGQMAQLEFSLQLLIKMMSGEDCSKTLEEAEAGEVFEQKILKSIKRKVNRLSGVPESKKKETEIWNFKKKLFSYCGMME